jgi:O-antigen/teichoic acid export membrane protein
MTNSYDQAIVGEFEFVRSILLLLGSLVICGADHSILQITGILKSKKSLKELSGVYSKVVTVSLIISIILIIVFLITPEPYLLFFLSDELGLESTWKVILILFFYAILQINAQVFRAYNQHELAEIYRGVFKYTPLFIGSFSLLLLERPDYIVDLFLYSFIPLSIWSTVHVLLVLGKLNYRTTYSFTQLLKKSFPMATSDLGFFVLLSIDVLFLKKYYSESVIAVYAQPVKIIAIVAIIQTTLQSAIASNVSEMFETGRKTSLKLILSKTTRQIVLYSVPVLLIIFFFPSYVLSVFGQEYTAGSSVLKILALGVLLGALCGCSGLYLNMTGRQVTLQYIIGMTIILNFILNYYLIPSYGILGAAVASSMSIVFWNSIAVLVIWRTDGFIIGLR